MSALDSFIEIAQWAESRESAQAYLDAANGNVEMALMLYFEGQAPPTTQPADPVPRNAAQVPASPGPAPRSLMEELNAEYKRDLVKASAPRVPDRLVYYRLRLPAAISGLLVVVDKLVGLLYRLFPSPLRAGPAAAESALDCRLRYFDTTVSPVLAAMGSAHAPPAARFLPTSSYNDALEHTKAQFKFLLVVIVSEVHESSVPAYLHNVFATDAAKRDDVCIWVGSALFAEGLGVANAFDAAALPMVTLVGASPKSADSSVIVMERLVQITGAEALSTQGGRAAFSERVAAAVANQEPKLLSLKLNRQQFSVDREIRKEQDSAYERSLQADRQKAEKARIERETQAAQQRRHAAWLARVAQRAGFYASAADVPGSSARVSLRLPSGERLNKKFPGDAPISDVFDVVYMHLHSAEPPFNSNPSAPAPNPEATAETANCPTSEASANPGDTPDDVDPDYAPYGFTLTSTVMRRQLPYSNTTVRDNDALWPSGVLMVDLD